MCLNAHCRVKFMCVDLIFVFLILSTIKKCPHMLRSDHKVLRKLREVGVGCGGQRPILALALQEVGACQ